MDPINKKALKAAVLIHEHMAAGQRRDASVYLPEYSWNSVQQLRRQIEMARERGWHRAAASLAEDLGRRLDDCRRELESALHALRACPAERPVSPASDVYRDILALYDEFEEVEIDLKGHELSVTTDCIVLEDVTLGPFQIRLDWERMGCSSQPYRVVATEPNPPAARDNVTHPHVQDEQLCEGDGRPAIRAALAECRLYDFMLLVSQVLHTYARGSGYVELADWDGTPCEGCGNSLGEDDRYYCNRCEATICGSCSASCQACGDAFCSGCLGNCAACGGEFCSSCMTTCRGCRKQVCDDCCEAGVCQRCREKQQQKEREDDSSENAENEPVAAEA